LDKKKSRSFVCKWRTFMRVAFCGLSFGCSIKTMPVSISLRSYLLGFIRDDHGVFTLVLWLISWRNDKECVLPRNVRINYDFNYSSNEKVSICIVYIYTNQSSYAELRQFQLHLQLIGIRDSRHRNVIILRVLVWFFDYYSSLNIYVQLIFTGDVKCVSRFDST
jgi:hypothetical protein